MGLKSLLSLISKSSIFTLLFGSLFYSSLAIAATPDAATMLENFATTVPQLMRLLTALAYVIGMMTIFRGIYKLKEYGEQRSMMSSQHDLKGPIILFIVGTFLLYLPSAVTVGMHTFWKDPNPYGYIQETNDQWSILYQDVFLVIQLIGTIAFVRGLLTLSKLGGQAQPGEFAKGMTYIIAGAMCINLYDFLNAVQTTLGLTGVVS